MQIARACRIRPVLLAILVTSALASRRAEAQVDAGPTVETIVTNPTQVTAALRAQLVVSIFTSNGQPEPDLLTSIPQVFLSTIPQVFLTSIPQVLTAAA